MTRSLFAHIESDMFAMNLAVVGGVKPFTRALKAQTAVSELVRHARADVDVARAVLNRLLHLSRLDVDLRYENPNDIAIAAYLTILSSVSPHLCSVALDEVMSSHNLWWAALLAKATLAESLPFTLTETVVLGEPGLTEVESVGTLDGTVVSRLLSAGPIPGFLGARTDPGATGDGQPIEAAVGVASSASDSQYAFAA